MAERTREGIRNLAIVAHVDHGKTSLVDAMLWQSGIFAEMDYVDERVLRALDLDREKGITVMAKCTSIPFRDTRVNIVDMPGRADFGGEVERTMSLVDGVLLLVDACEGPVPQTRFALRKALEASLAPVVVITKIDLEGARPAEVLREIRELFVDLDATEQQQDFAVLYCNARMGSCRRDPSAADGSLMTLFDQILETVPAPTFDPESPLQFLITRLDYDDFLGRMASGRVHNGSLEKDAEVAHCRLDGSIAACKITGVFGIDGLRRIELQTAGPGDLVAVTGLDSVQIGESLSELSKPRPLPPLKIDEPTLALALSVNDSPTAGLDGTHVSGAKLRERLFREILTNVSVKVEETDSPDAFRLSGRGELQLAMLIEMVRREGYELLVGKPEVLMREVDGRLQEPMELMIADCPERFVGVVTERIGARQGRLTKMVNHGTGRVRLEYRIPARGLIGFRTDFLSDTKGTGILNHQFDGYDAWQGEIAERSTGSLVADRPGRATAHAIEHLQPRGAMFLAPGDEVYEGLIVGENSHSKDRDVDVTKEKKVAGVPAPIERTVRLIPPRSMSLEQALEFVREDELVEVTPRALRLRKRVLQATLRQRKA